MPSEKEIEDVDKVDVITELIKIKSFKLSEQLMSYLRSNL